MQTTATNLADLRSLLRARLDFDAIGAEPIVTGYANNNRLVRLHARDGRSAVAKVYYRDDRRRLEREFNTLRFLQTRGMARVPTPLLRCDHLYAAVYTDESGVTKPSAELTTHDATELACFLADLHRIRPDDPGANFPAAVAAAFSLDAKLAAIRQRLRLFVNAATAAAAPVRSLCSKIDVAGTLERLLIAATSGIDATALAEAAVAGLPEVSQAT